MLSNLIEQIKAGLFSRSFWFGNFLPVGIVAVLHLLLVEYAYPGTAPISEWWAASFAEQASETSLALVGLIVLAYALAPFIPAARDILDGQSMPRGLHNWLRDRRVDAWAQAEAARENETKLHAFLKHRAPHVEASGDIGLKLDDPTVTSPVEAPGLAELERAIASLSRRHSVHQPLAFDAVVKAYAALAQIVADTNRDNGAGWIPPIKINAPPVQRQIDALTRLMAQLKADIAYRRRMFLPPPARKDIAATRVGEMRIFVENYSKRLYGVDFNYIWPRIQMLLKDDDPIAKRLQDAQAAINFSVLTFVLLQSVPIVWIFVLWRLSDAWGLFAVGFGAVLLIWFAYEMVVQSQLVFGRLAWTAIDKHRLQVLTDIAHQARPQTLLAERQLWQALHDNADRGDAHDLFLHEEGTT